MTDQPVLEKHTIGYVPPEDRHGKVRDLFTLWFGTNIAPLPVVTGAAGVTVFGLDLVWCDRSRSSSGTSSAASSWHCTPRRARRWASRR